LVDSQEGNAPILTAHEDSVALSLFSLVAEILSEQSREFAQTTTCCLGKNTMRSGDGVNNFDDRGQAIKGALSIPPLGLRDIACYRTSFWADRHHTVCGRPFDENVPTARSTRRRIIPPPQGLHIRRGRVSTRKRRVRLSAIPISNQSNPAEGWSVQGPVHGNRPLFRLFRVRQRSIFKPGRSMREGDQR